MESKISLAIRHRDWAAIAAILVGVAAFTAGYELLAPHHHAPRGMSLTNLSSVQQLQTRFNESRGEIRLILIFSPT